MAGGLAALLDDVAAIARAAAASVDDIAAAAGKASTKAVGVVVDDAAVTPRYVTGITPARELPMIKAIAIGSLRNKLIFILPAILVLSQFLPWILTPLLMCGGLYLSFEGAEKIWEKLSGHGHAEKVDEVALAGPEQEKQLTSGAIRTDFILSAEIMVISLNEVAAEAFWTRAVILVVVAIAITILVYGVVALIVKMDDIGLHLAERPAPRRSASAAPWSPRCPRCSRRSPSSARSRCSGSAATSCSTASTSSAGRRPMRSSTTSRTPRRTPSAPRPESSGGS